MGLLFRFMDWMRHLLAASPPEHLRQGKDLDHANGNGREKGRQRDAGRPAASPRSNEKLVDAPETINGDAYGDGWLFVVMPSDRSELDELLSPDDYAEMIESEDH